ncbi:hypothetical protein [Chitinophaga sp.]|uniref:hypothetical protein n=1 Tax=Chitinophaga sp. TaxID=1869181 RepID=UPI0031CF6BC1
MKSLSFDQMQQIEGGFNWRDAADGFCLVAGLASGVGAVACTAYGAARLFNLI